MHHGRLVIIVHVHPGSRRASVGGRHGDALVVRVAARAAQGAANEEVLVRLARAFAVRSHDVTYLQVTSSRDKRVAIEGDGEQLALRHLELLALDAQDLLT